MQTRKSIEQRRAACEGVLLNEDPLKRAEDSMDYIQDPFFQMRLSFPVVCGSRASFACKARSGAGSHPKKLWRQDCASKLAKSSPASKIALPVRPYQIEVDPPSEIPCWCRSDKYAASRRGRWEDK